MDGTNANSGRKRSSFREQVERERREGGVHQSGGGQGVADFFSAEHRYKPITRGEFLGWMELLEYSRKSSVWWRRLGRLLTRTPGVQNLSAQMADAYWRGTLKPALDQVRANLEQKAAKKNAAVTDA